MYFSKLPVQYFGRSFWVWHRIRQGARMHLWIKNSIPYWHFSELTTFWALQIMVFFIGICTWELNEAYNILSTVTINGLSKNDTFRRYGLNAWISLIFPLFFFFFLILFLLPRASLTQTYNINVPYLVRPFQNDCDWVLAKNSIFVVAHNACVYFHVCGHQINVQIIRFVAMTKKWCGNECVHMMCT